MSKNNKILEQFKDGIITNNPTFVQLLGTCPALATTTSASNALGMGISVILVLMCSNMFISLLRKFIPNQIRIASYIVIISGFVSALELLIKAFLPSLSNSLGLFIPLIVVNCIILARAEAFASKNKVLPSIVDGLAMGAGFTLALVILGAIREIIGAGTIFGISVFGDWFEPAVLFILPPGAFITLGFVIALVQKIRSRHNEYVKSQELERKRLEREAGLWN
ncbi:MAG: electron transport complex subunit E [Clostridia bacterium]|nr:electron transport complex subunit E [Clostridia bacterium]